MKITSRWPGAAMLVVLASIASVAAPTAASADQVVVDVGSPFTAAGTPITFDGSTFTFFASGDFFSPTAVQTSGGAEFLTVFGAVSTFFPQRGSGVLSFGPEATYSAVPTETIVSYSNGDNIFGLSATQNGQTFYGYAYTTNNVLNSYGYQTTPGTAFVLDTNAPAAVPEPASWALLIGGTALAGMSLRRRRQAAFA